jgi:hypothetical protein
MALVTGTPIGNVLSQDELYIEGAPYIYIQDYSASPRFNPDVDGYYWGLSGTATQPVYGIGCVLDVQLTEGVVLNAIRCDTGGDKGVIQKRNYLEFAITIASLFPLSTLRHMLNLAIPKTGLSKLEKTGISVINNTRYYMAYCPKVYDNDLGSYLMVHLHRAQFVDAWTINFKAGEPWTVTGLKLRAFQDDSKPGGMEFGTIVRADTTRIP